MIAKVLRSGSGFSGVIDYLYEGRLEDRKAEDKQAEVLLHSENLRVPRDWQDKAGRQLMKADFIEQAKSHPRYKERNKDLIGEHVLSFTQDDLRKLKTKQGVAEVAGEYVKMMGLDKTQHVAILHKDTDNPHLHILFNRVTNEGKKFDDSWEKKRTTSAGVALSQKHELHLVKGLGKERRDPRVAALRGGMEDLKKQQAQHPVLVQARNMHHLEKLADKQGLAFERTGEQITLDSQKYKLSDLEAMFQANRNEAALAKTAQSKAIEEQPRPSASETTAPAVALPTEKKLVKDGYDEFLNELRQQIPLLQTATSVTQLQQAAQEQGVRYDVDPEWGTTLGERTVMKSVIEDIVAQNAARQSENQTFRQPEEGPKETSAQLAELESKLQSAISEVKAAGNQQEQVGVQTQPDEADQIVEKPPILDYAISRWQLAELAQKTETPYQEHDDRSVSVGGQTLDEATLDNRLEENRGRYEQMRYQEIQQALGEQMAKARSRAELTHFAKLQGEKSDFKPELTLTDKAGRERHFDDRDVDTILSSNLKTSATPPEQLLGGAGATMTNMGHVKIIAEKFGMKLTEDDHSITTVDKRGNVEAFDKKEVLAMLDVNQAKKIAEFRTKYSFLNEVESFKEFEEQAQEKKVDYKAVQASDAAQALRAAQEMIKAGTAQMNEGIKKLDQADKMVTAGQVMEQKGKRLIEEGRQEQGERAIGLGKVAVEEGSRIAVEAEKAVNEGELTVQLGTTMVETAKALGEKALQNYEQGPGELPPGSKVTNVGSDPKPHPGQLAGAEPEAQKTATTAEKILTVLRGENQKKEPVKAGDTDYIISDRTRYIKMPDGQQLHRAEMRKIIEENKIERSQKFDRVHQSSRLLRESTSFGNLMSRAKDLEMKVEVKGRYVEIEGIKEPIRVRMSDLQDMMFLNAMNHKGQEFDHRKTADGQGTQQAGEKTGKEQSKLSGPSLGMVSEPTQKAQPEKRADEGKVPRKRGKRVPDFRQKIEKQERHRRKSQKI